MSAAGTQRTPVGSERSTLSPGQAGARRALATQLVVDVALPVIAYYVLRALGASVLWAAVGSGAVPAVRTALVALAARRIDVAGLVVLSLFVAGGVLSVVTGDARLVFAKDGWLTGALGVWVLVSLVMARPFMVHLGVAIATVKVGDEGAAAWERRWTQDDEFRRRLRLVSVVIGVVLVLDAVVRVVIALTLTLDEVPTATNVQYVVMLAGLLTWFFWYTGKHGLRA
jgi:hypothetical protein